MSATVDSPTEEQPPEQSRSKLAVWWKSTSSWAVSMVLHFLVLILLALMSLPALREEIEFGLEAAVSDEFSDVEQITELEMPEELEVEELEPLSEVDPSTMQLGDLSSAVNLVAESLSAGDFADIPDTLGNPLGAIGGEMNGESGGPMVPTTFFGAKAVARRVLFVVDNSNSMTKGKLETAIVEMVRAIDQLKPTQQFYIIFYSDTAYPLFHPQPAKTFVKATKYNKEKTRSWLGTIEMCLRTNGQDAVAMTRKLRPDLIFLLGDGAFTDRTARDLVDNPIRGATIHTLGMQVKAKDQAEFKAIAEKHKGTYRDVGITAEGRSLFEQYGARPRHRVQGYVWGLKLPKKTK